MRISALLLSAAAFVAVQFGVAWAEDVRLAPVSYSPEFQAQLQDDFGEREGVYLSRSVERALDAAFARRGLSTGTAGGVVVETTIVDADPNRPTFQQLSDEPGLDAMRSFSIGGAELRAVLRTPDGRVLSEVRHRRYDMTIEDVLPASTWSTAHQAIRQFANKVANAYAAHSS